MQNSKKIRMSQPQQVMPPHVHMQQQQMNPQMGMQPQLMQSQQHMPPGAQMAQGSTMSPGTQLPQQSQMQQQPPQQVPPPQRSQPQEDKLVSNARKLVCGPLKDKWSQTLREAALRIYQNGVHDVGLPGTSSNLPPQGKFENNLEDFHAICDQIELNLKCAIQCMNQSSASNRYMPIPPNLSRTELGNDYLTYPQYINTSKQQIIFAEDVRQMLNQAATDVVERNVPT
ncbi:mediator of RNA polymerase II transcription subunit 29 isoform X1 [Lepeophtheirus salmonis]|uniref:Mediator of RNA polymerase II transcription subunit 29 n=2 Tax=Lepeophtheirus salmonis TaxID=72036 RepID=A0A0K2T3J3_LEPSM|nr:mediator of RNA polymerase II transcription subunit 29-like isoform X1 [Lepeophtheirus salmonis]XP_040572972.1 mediator of RNA polymerase II transcription subunit 29-like isoform X1 [Lepeophtheirus salmonis]XP_040572973.1 mediator of RNA polymerase II transcription subunit 29-like isoform X1 [Lepeophtheirus salmonis]